MSFRHSWRGYAVLAWLFASTAQAGPTTPAPALATASAAAPAPAPAPTFGQVPVPAPQPQLLCAFVQGSLQSLKNSAGVRQSAATADAATNTSAEAHSLPAECTLAEDSKRGTLVGSGDLILVANRKSWQDAIAIPSQASARPRLFVNGIDAGGDAALEAVEFRDENTVWLRFHIAANKSTRPLWVALYREHALTDDVPLRVALGWSNVPTTVPADRGPRIQITSEIRRTVALAAIGLLGSFFVFLLMGTDAFRDKVPADQLALVRVAQLTIGKRVRATYSLARFQVGIWLLFIVASAIFMWLILGELPTPEPTLVALLTVSAVTTAVSIAVDGNAASRPFTPSRGLLNDITTGWDGTQQLHRIQALAVNALLLVAGIDAVSENLAYPVFDTPWLSLLGVSGIAQAGGKQMLENVSPNSGPLVTTSVTTPAGVTPVSSVPAGRAV